VCLDLKREENHSLRKAVIIAIPRRNRKTCEDIKKNEKSEETKEDM
jgi:hypothetical protein